MGYQESVDKVQNAFLQKQGWKWNIFKMNPVLVHGQVLYRNAKKVPAKKMSSRIRKGNKYLKATLVVCARAAIRNKQSYLYSRYQRIAARRGGKRALIAIAHTMLTAIYHMLKEKVPYCDLGADYYTNIQHDKLIKRNLRSLVYGKP